MTPSGRVLNILMFAAIFTSSCSKAPPPAPAAARPGPGDKVFPVVTCPKSWRAGAPVVLSVRLGVQGPDDAKPLLLKFEDVPVEPELRAKFTFFKDNEVVKTHTAVKLVPDC